MQSKTKAKTASACLLAPLALLAVELLINASFAPVVGTGCILNCSFCKGDPITDLLHFPLDAVMPLAALQGCNCNATNLQFQCQTTPIFQDIINLIYQLNVNGFCKCVCTP